MRLLRVIATVNPKGGGPMEGIRQITPLLHALGHGTEILSVDAPDDSWVPDCPIPVHALGPGRTGYCFAPGMAPWLRRNASRFDAVIVHGLWQHGGFATRQALRGTQTPYFVYTHGMLDPWFNRAYPLKHMKKSLYWPWGERLVLRDARAVLFTCEEEKRLARESFRPYQVNEAVVSYGTAGPTGSPEALRAAFLEAFPALAGKRLLLFLSRIHVKKGCDLLLEAFSRAASSDPSLHLVMAGPDRDGLQPGLQRLAQERGIGDRLTWTGMLTGEKKWGAFFASEAFLLPSHQENFGIAVAEALACGLPVLISDKVNIWREIAADGAGIVAEDTLDGVQEQLAKWLMLPDAQKQEMGRQARQCFAERFEIHQAARSLIDVLCAHGVG